MHRDDAIEFQRKALLCEVAWLFSFLKIAPGGSVPTVSRFIANSILFVLRPAESALRRLLVIEARALKGKVMLRVQKASDPKTKAVRRNPPRARAARLPLFPLFDKPIRERKIPDHQEVPKVEPRITVLNIGMTEIEHHIWRQQQRAVPKPKRKPMPPRNAPPNAVRLCRRLSALHYALHDIPKQAERMARALARREVLAPEDRGDGPLRHGHPPGHRQRKRHEIDLILRDCVALEREAFDTS